MMARLIKSENASVGQMLRSPSAQLITNFYSSLQIWENAKFSS